MDAIRKKARKQEEPQETSMAAIVLCALKALGITAAVAFVLLLAGSAIAYSGSDPDTLVRPVSYVVLFLSALLCGILARMFCPQKGLIAGAIAGIMMMLATWVLSLFFGMESTLSLPLSLGLHAAIVALALLGTLISMYFAAKRASSRRPAHKRRRPAR